MKAILLGCGTSGGVPRIGNDWGACDPSNPRNCRSRVSIIIEHDGQRILVDTSPDLRHQLLREHIGALDAVIWTHDHADHTHGIDDLRALFHRTRSWGRTLGDLTGVASQIHTHEGRYMDWLGTECDLYGLPACAAARLFDRMIQLELVDVLGSEIPPVA